MRILEAPTKVKGKTYRRWMLVYYRPDGSRARESYNTKAKAEEALKARVNEIAAERERQAILMRHIGEKAKHLRADDLLDCVQALDLLQGRAKLSDIAREYAVARESSRLAAIVREGRADYNVQGARKWIEFRVGPDAFLMVAEASFSRASPSTLRILAQQITDQLIRTQIAR